MRIDNSIFWGVFLLIIGVLIVLKYTLHLNISIFRIGIAIILIWIGITLIIGQWGIRDSSNIIFSERELRPETLEKEYNIIFGNGYIDLSSLLPSEFNKSIKIATVFSRTTLKIDQGKPIVIDIDCVFGSAKAPDGKVESFGRYLYKTPSVDISKEHLRIKADTVFGKLEVIQ